MASGIYERFFANLMNKIVDLEADTINVALMKTGHAPFDGTDNVWGDVSAQELDNGNGYTTGGVALSGLAVTQGTTTKWDDTGSPEWTAATFSAYHAVIYDITATSNLICSIDFGGRKNSHSGHVHNYVGRSWNYHISRIRSKL